MLLLFAGFLKILIEDCLCLADLLEEEFEQEFLSRTARRGQIDLQIMHFFCEYRYKMPRFRTHSFDMDFSKYRDISIAVHLLEGDMEWVVELKTVFGDEKVVVDGGRVLFKTGGANMLVTSGNERRSSVLEIKK